ncbi:cd7 antigen-like [Mugil cephalus]|uniref:cd7 antigen-like n=1 Tax=Mugil cephalus TaxID=48193 RepID=UPI001FB82B5E|nr:cd7 antigen-like [Mugil cephalus]
MMTGTKYLACLWTVVITQAGFVCGDIQFLERHEGESVVLPCVVEKRSTPPFGVYLKRSWLRPGEVLFHYTKSKFQVNNSSDKNRTSVDGDPSLHSVNVTISQLRVRDTDRYYCEFLVENPSSEDEKIQGTTEFFLFVNPDAPGSVDMELVETCAGGSAVLPCLPSHGEGLAPVEGVSVKRQRGMAPVEVLYDWKRHSSSNPSSSSQFHLSSTPSPGGIVFKLTVQQLQPEDSGLYSCQLFHSGSPDVSTSLGRHVVFVSVQGDRCGCSSYPTLLYTLSSAVVLLLLLLLAAFVAIYKCKATRKVKSRPQAPIYEEMVGVAPHSRKLGPSHLEEAESSEYRNCPMKKSCPDNYYESPSGALRLKR